MWGPSITVFDAVRHGAAFCVAPGGSYSFSSGLACTSRRLGVTRRIGGAGWTRRTARVVREARERPRCMMPGNIEDLPMEAIPNDGSPMPGHWRRPGVYGVYAEDGSLQFVAAASDVGEAVYGHVKTIKDGRRVYAVRMLTVDEPDSAPLDQMSENWVMALFNSGLPVPPGNTDEAPEWRETAWVPDIYFTGAMVAGNTESRVEEEIKKILRDHTVVLFMKGTRASPRCGFSKAVVDVLERQVGDGFVCVDCLDTGRNFGLREGIKRFSSWPTIPQLYVNGDFVGGADIVQGMESNGELSAVLHS